MQVDINAKKKFLVERREINIPFVANCHYYLVKTIAEPSTCMDASPYWITSVEVSLDADKLYL